jgi:hypothetical protein
MAIPSSGPLSLDDIQTEFGGTNPIDLSEYYAGGANVPPGTTGDSGPIPTSGEIAVGEFYGATSRVPIVINNTGTTLKASIYTLASADPTYTAGITDVVYNNSGTLYTDRYTTGALETGTFASGDTVKIVNTGLIIGKGGNGGDGNPTGINYPAHASGDGPGTAGGRALELDFPVTIDNTGGTIAGGGGGGAGGFSGSWGVPRPKNPPSPRTVGGSGGGGGAGTDVGLGGALGTAASPGNHYPGTVGSNGTPTAGGSGGTPTNYPFVPAPVQPLTLGGAGGGRGQAGSSTTTGTWTATGGAAGQAIVSNGNTITWINTGTINGPTT